MEVTIIHLHSTKFMRSPFSTSKTAASTLGHGYQKKSGMSRIGLSRLVVRGLGLESIAAKPAEVNVSS